MNQSRDDNDRRTLSTRETGRLMEQLLASRHVLLLESNALIAMDMNDMLQERGAKSVRIAARIGEALAQVKDGLPDLAMLSLPENPASLLAFAQTLMTAGVSCIFLGHLDHTLYGAQQFSAVPFLNKPVSADDLDTLLIQLFGAPPSL